MSFKDKLEGIKMVNPLVNEVDYDKLIKDETPISLSEKINEITTWYKENNYSGGMRDNETFMRDTIEKMAVWYELKYPITSHKNLIDYQYIKNYSYTYDGIEENKNSFDFNQFLETLSPEEKTFFAFEDDPKFPRYRDITIQNLGEYHLRFEFDNDGTIIQDANFTSYIPKEKNIAGFESYIGWNIEQFYEVFKNTDLDLQSIELMLKNYKIEQKSKDLFLEAVLLRIIERGYAGIGSMRGLLFAKEFNRNIDIPMYYAGFSTNNFYSYLYGHNCQYNKHNIKTLAEEYLKLGGDENLACLLDYWYFALKNEPVKYITVKELIENDKTNTQNNQYHKLIENIAKKEGNNNNIKLKIRKKD